MGATSHSSSEGQRAWFKLFDPSLMYTVCVCVCTKPTSGHVRRVRGCVMSTTGHWASLGNFGYPTLRCHLMHGITFKIRHNIYSECLFLIIRNLWNTLRKRKNAPTPNTAPHPTTWSSITFKSRVEKLVFLAFFILFLQISPIMKSQAHCELLLC